MNPITCSNTALASRPSQGDKRSHFPSADRTASPNRRHTAKCSSPTPISIPAIMPGQGVPKPQSQGPDPRWFVTLTNSWGPATKFREACLSCSKFVTDATFSDALQRQRIETQQLIQKRQEAHAARFGEPMTAENIWLRGRNQEVAALDAVLVSI